MFVLFPFEAELYKKEGINAECIGHPLSEITQGSQKTYTFNQNEIKIGILPGSRIGVLGKHMPVLVESARKLRSTNNHLTFFLFLSATISDNDMARYIQDAGVEFKIVRETDFEMRSRLQCAWCCSGTATLELAFLGIPSICFYKTNLLNYWLAKRLMRIEKVAMPNILAGKELMPELIQDGFTVARIAGITEELITHPEKLRQQHVQLRQITSALNVKDFYKHVAHNMLMTL
jgi:lipid-A-disaccharide synthase